MAKAKVVASLLTQDQDFLTEVAAVRATLEGRRVVSPAS